MKKTNTTFHPRNRHQGHYDFEKLIIENPELAQFILNNAYGDVSIDFTNPIAVKALNRALLKSDYGVTAWDIPEQQLCPPVPGRADYLHHLADLLTFSHGGKLPKKHRLTVLDIGTGANGIYPLLGVSEYGWQFVASDINPLAIANVEKILAANPHIARQVTLRLQTASDAILKHVIHDDDWFDLSMCNPPFHNSLADAQSGAERKWKNLGKASSGDSAAPTFNFGGKDAELWCPGGELAFIRQMIQESASMPGRCFWYTSLVSKAANLSSLKAQLKAVHAKDVKEIAMGQGNKQSRFLAWTFLTPSQQQAWKALRW